MRGCARAGVGPWNPGPVTVKGEDMTSTPEASWAPRYTWFKLELIEEGEVGGEGRKEGMGLLRNMCAKHVLNNTGKRS